MKKLWTLFLAIAFLSFSARGQDRVPLFQSREPINIRAQGSIKSIKKKSNDSTLVAAKFEYQQDADTWINVPVRARVRGNFRLKNCYFPPLKLKFKKNEVASTLFEGNKALKLVVPCLTTSDKNKLIRKEYLCYQFYEVLSPYHFRTRLANLKLTEVSRKQPRDYDLMTFFVEDNSMVAKRSNGKIMETKSLRPAAFDEKQAIRNDYIQFMIGNADWSAVFQHNSNVLYADQKYITLAYDFDMAGFVDASYARDNPPQLGTGDSRERVYRGYCKSESVMQEIRREFLENEGKIQALIDTEEPYFSAYDLKDMHNYIDQFFSILKSDGQFKDSILERCRKE